MDEPRHLFIDGYNVLYAWKWLRRGRESGSALETARQRLIEAVRPLRDVDGLDVTVVFDGKGATAHHDAGASDADFSVVFAPSGKTADSVIETMVAALRDPRTSTVATADAAERETVSAAGAACVSPEDLLAWCERSRARAAQTASRRNDTARAAWHNRLPL